MKPSKNVISRGEFERMMAKVGCYIRNDFYFEKSRSVTDSPDTTSRQNTSIDCAQACFNAGGTCRDGWSFEISTKSCFYLNQIDVSVLRPNYQLQWANMTLGWATGRKSCTLPGPGELENITAYGGFKSRTRSSCMCKNITN